MQVLEKCRCEKAAVYEVLRRGVKNRHGGGEGGGGRGAAQVFTRYHEKEITRIRFQKRAN